MNLNNLKPAVEKTETTAAAANPAVEESKPNPELQAELVINEVANSGVTGPAEGEVIYSSHPISNFKMGRFHFENGTLTLSGGDVEEFEKLLNHPNMPLSDRNLVQKLDFSRVDAIVEQRAAAAATKQFDSSVGRSALEMLKQQSPTVGTEKIGE